MLLSSTALTHCFPTWGSRPLRSFGQNLLCYDLRSWFEASFCSPYQDAVPRFGEWEAGLGYAQGLIQRAREQARATCESKADQNLQGKCVETKRVVERAQHSEFIDEGAAGTSFSLTAEAVKRMERNLHRFVEGPGEREANTQEYKLPSKPQSCILYCVATEAVERMESDMQRLVERSALQVHDLPSPQRDSSREREMRLRDPTRASIAAARNSRASIPGLHSPRQNKKSTLDVCMHNGLVLHQQGSLLKAEQCYKQAHDIAMEIGEAHITGRVCFHLGCLYNAMGRYAKGKAMHERASELTEIEEEEERRR